MADADLLRDPKRLAALLARTFSLSNEAPTAAGEDAKKAEEREEESATGADGGDEDQDGDEDEEEDNTEEVEEEMEQEEEEQSLDERPLEEEELEAAAAALQAATRIVDELRLKVVLKTGKHMEHQQSIKQNFRTRSGSGDSRQPGVPKVNARPLDGDHCKRCSRSFNAFHRSKNCTACGFSFCLKCVSNQHVLPTRFGYKANPVRVCDLCVVWFQRALDRYFDAMDSVKPQESKQQTPASLSPESPPRQLPQQQLPQPRPIPRSLRSESGEIEVTHRNSNGPHSFTSAPVSASSVIDSGSTRSDRGYAAEENNNDRGYIRRNHRRSQSVSLASKSPVTKPWFSGHLRAMHVGDRLPRKHKASVDGSEPDADVGGGSRDRSSVSRTMSLGGPVYSSPTIQSSVDDAHRRHNQLSPQTHDLDGETWLKSPPSIPIPMPELPALPQNTQRRSSANELKNRSLSKKSSRKSRFGRSASFDLTTLHPPSQSPTGSMVSSPAKEGNGRVSELSVECSPLDMSTASSDHKSFLLKKCFDDSDIVDERAAEISTDEHHDVALPVAVLRFAVYEMGAKENSGLRRALGFAKANPVLDRYTLELDCRQGVVRVKSVFMHRFWWFHCDSVQSFTAGTSVGTARLVIFNGGQGNQTLELKFANDEEREEFHETMESCRSSSLRSMDRFDKNRTNAFADHIASNSSSSLPLASTEFDGKGGSSNEDSPELGGTEPICSVDSPKQIAVDFPYLPGEEVIKDTELPATLLIGPAGDSTTFETTLVWGRLRGMVAVTNYRVLFTPFDRVSLLSRPTDQFSAAYIPLFAITNTQLLYPGGRRTKAGRTYYAGMTGSASIIAISCKDIRSMRLQLDGPQSTSDELTQKLYSTIREMSDASQRYTKVEVAIDSERNSRSDIVSLTGNISLSASSGDAGDSNEDRDSRDNRLSYGKSPFFGPVSSASPVLRPNFDASALRELSGSFAFTFNLSWVPPDQNGWNVFLDEREFKRQIGGDSAVSPFLKYYQNAKGNICKTYPSKLLLPASMTSATLAKVANFRAKNRLPVITYYHRRNRCVLTRSSQPLLGSLLSGSSNISDQLLVGVYRRLPDIIKNQNQSSASSRPIYIFDARKPKASTGNRLMGKGGVETSQDYPGAVIHHLHIANMYRMQSSFMSLMKLLLPGGVEDDKAWWPNVESTRWLEHVRVVLDGAMKIARVLELEGSSALVHCSDGWDRTAQLTTLAQLMIDPYFRTIRGFAVLVEKDWCAFGHKFNERLGGDRNRDPQRSKSSPIFFQFLDAVWQIQRQFPGAFEFNERFLLHLANALTSGLYGTFLYDSRLQRDVNEVERASVSVWTPVLMHPAQFRNPEYVEVDGPIWPWVTSKMIRLWENYFFQWHPKFYNCQWVSTVVASHRKGSTRKYTSATSVEDKSTSAASEISDTPPLALPPTLSSPTAIDAMIPPLNLATPPCSNCD